MKSLVFTGMLSLAVAHAGAFLSVWDVPYIKDHLTVADLGRKLNKVFKWSEQANSLREARTEAREENFALLDDNNPEQIARRRAFEEGLR